MGIDFQKSYLLNVIHSLCYLYPCIFSMMKAFYQLMFQSSFFGFYCHLVKTWFSGSNWAQHIICCWTVQQKLTQNNAKCGNCVFLMLHGNLKHLLKALIIISTLISWKYIIFIENGKDRLFNMFSRMNL